MDLKHWLKEVRGRASNLALHLGASKAAITQWTDEGGQIPTGRHHQIHSFTNGEVGYLDQLSDAKRLETIRRHKFITAEIARLPRATK